VSKTAEFSCRCGEVQARLSNASPTTVNRCVCYCADCQAYLHHLGRTDLMDEHGGTDVVQVAPASLSFHRGSDRIVAVRLGPKGLFRWYASCCKTPVGNTAGPAIPFIGIVAHGFGGRAAADDAFGKPVGGVLGKYAIGTPPPGSTGLNAKLVLRVLALVLGWKLRGRTWPHPFFDRATGAPKHPVTVLSRAERDALRPLCGPRPSAVAAPAR
jgi:hypothetical protein